ncbi:M48 family metallopeptidase [Patescibacteria group bacterium]|nr:M48 family metallopeptidase [Patescibacteria group bacterium]MBU4511968.1 M48 family metallopeptidase [Patescibacteria group bacterium]MCG2693372.1 M48 family metallopeptidase [Candidatus Parcubacteria bacterium]
MYRQIESNKRRSIILIALFIIIIAGIGWAFGELTEFGYWGLVLALIISVLMALVGYYQGDKIALWTAGAKPLAKQDNPYVYRMVENLCITAGLPVPKIYIINDPAPNAFAAGRDPKHASVALTTGIIERLENEELEGVIAHELSHIKNYDMRLMTLVVVLVGIIALLANWFWRIQFFGGGRRRNSRSGGQLGMILMIVGIILMILSPLIAQLIKLAISRKREFLADASASLLTRYPEGLARALEKISSSGQPLLRANNATAHLYIASPFGAKASKGMAKLFSTHPPIEERVRALRRMA